jgi:hypothetical protein
MRFTLLGLLFLALHACAEDGMNQRIHIADVGTFMLETIENMEGYNYYLCERPGKGSEPLSIVIYPERDVVDALYAERIRKTVSKVVAEHPRMVARAEAQIRELMGRYGLDVPDDFSSLVGAQYLTHIKIEEDGAEIIFDTCPFFPSFDLNATLSDDAEITTVWFDG